MFGHNFSNDEFDVGKQSSMLTPRRQRRTYQKPQHHRARYSVILISVSSHPPAAAGEQYWCTRVVRDEVSKWPTRGSCAHWASWSTIFSFHELIQLVLFAPETPLSPLDREHPGPPYSRDYRPSGRRNEGETSKDTKFHDVFEARERQLLVLLSQQTKSTTASFNVCV